MSKEIPWLRKLNEFATLHFSTTYSQFIDSIERDSSQIRGTYLLVGENGKPVSVVTDGDIRRIMSSLTSTDLPLAKLIVPSRCNVDKQTVEDLTAIELYSHVQTLARSAGLKEVPRYIPYTQEGAFGRIIDTLRLADHLNRLDAIPASIGVIGLGYVGLTLAVMLANKGFSIIGYDINNSLLAALSRGEPHIQEPNLVDMLKISTSNGTLCFDAMAKLKSHDAYIICVGTSIVDGKLDSEPVMDSIRSVLEVAPRYSHIYLRSTVPVGFCRSLLSVNEFSKMRERAGVFLSFAPERTVEGNAINELNTLPQVIGSISEESMHQARRLWSFVSSSVIECESIEEAEMIKLISNSYRDLTFGFANHVAMMCEDYGINAHNLIEKANDNYPRNSIARPSPGVGGYCLTKDPLLFEFSVKNRDFRLCSTARVINIHASKTPIRAFEHWLHSYPYPTEKLGILVVGLAFKGVPETTDIRSSPTIVLLEYLRLHGFSCDIIDFAFISVGENLKINGYQLLSKVPSAIEMSNYDAIFVMNNHPDNTTLELAGFASGSALRFLFDGWNQFQYVSRSTSSIQYATMGIVK